MYLLAKVFCAVGGAWLFSFIAISSFSGKNIWKLCESLFFCHHPQKETIILLDFCIHPHWKTAPVRASWGYFLLPSYELQVLSWQLQQLVLGLAGSSAPPPTRIHSLPVWLTPHHQQKTKNGPKASPCLSFHPGAAAPRLPAASSSCLFAGCLHAGHRFVGTWGPPRWWPQLAGDQDADLALRHVSIGLIHPWTGLLVLAPFRDNQVCAPVAAGVCRSSCNNNN